MTRDDLTTELARIFAGKEGIVGVCGLPGAGKSTLVRRLSDEFDGRALSINLDDFCIAPTKLRKSYLASALERHDMSELETIARPERPEDNPYADPLSWYDWEAAAEVLQSLKDGKTVIRYNAWNQETGECDKIITYQPPASNHPVYFVDCVYLYETPLRYKIDKFVMIEVEPAVSFAREKKRDAHRNSEIYAAYKNLVTNLYCIPYLEKYRANMDYIVF